MEVNKRTLVRIAVALALSSSVVAEEQVEEINDAEIERFPLLASMRSIGIARPEMNRSSCQLLTLWAWLITCRV